VTTRQRILYTLVSNKSWMALLHWPPSTLFFFNWWPSESQRQIPAVQSTVQTWDCVESATSGYRHPGRYLESVRVRQRAVITENSSKVEKEFNVKEHMMPTPDERTYRHFVLPHDLTDNFNDSIWRKGRNIPVFGREPNEPPIGALEFDVRSLIALTFPNEADNHLIEVSRKHHLGVQARVVSFWLSHCVVIGISIVVAMR
jgi:hypothetical protein